MRFGLLNNPMIGLLLLCGVFYSAIAAAKLVPDSHLSDTIAKSPHLQQVMGVEDARHLLVRSGIGAAPTALEALIGKTRIEGIRSIVAGIQTHPINAVPAWVLAPAPRYWSRSDMTRGQRREFNRARQREVSELRMWWVREMIETSSPQTERLLLFWHDHFATAYSAIDDMSTAIARQHLTLRSLAAGNFGELLRAVIRDAAMLHYLDNTSNSKHSPNENLAREFLELFTLGEGAYTESDVKNAAKALTGFSVASLRDQQFRFERWKHDYSQKTLFDKSGDFDGDDLVNLVLDQPATARFIAKKFWAAYINEHTHNSSDIELLAMHFRDSNYDIQSLLAHTLSLPAFWQSQNRGVQIKSPIDLVIGSVRSSGLVPTDWQTIPAQLTQLGQSLFEPPNVAGWPSGGSWITPSHLLNRAAWAREFISSDCVDCTSDSMSDGSMTMMMQGEINKVMQSGEALDGRKLSVRLASENLEGAPEFQLALKHAGETLWASPVLKVRGGHDTKRFGRLSGFSQLPWQTMHVETPDTMPNFDSVVVTFLNDHASADGDRNLYIDWISIEGQLYHTSGGKQDSECPPNNAENAGALYCNGSVTVNAAKSPSSSSPLPGFPSLLHASNAHLSWLNHPAQATSKDVSLAFVLTDLTFHNQHWENFYIQIQHTTEGGFKLQFDNFGCWPECLDPWPDCARQQVEVQLFRQLVLPLRKTDTKGELTCHFTALTDQQKQFVSLLWRSVPSIYDLVRKTRRVQKKPELSDRYHAWMPLIDQIRQQLPDSLYTDNRFASADTLLVVDGSFASEVTSSFDYLVETPPQAASSSFTHTLDAFSRLSELENADGQAWTMGEILISVPPASRISSTVMVSVEHAVQSPEFQLK